MLLAVSMPSKRDKIFKWVLLLLVTGSSFIWFVYNRHNMKLRTHGDLHIIRWKLSENISCHYSKKEDALPLVNDSFTPPEKSIFFIETSCRGGLTSRQACAVESAARSHLQWDVHVLFSSPVTDFVLKNSCLSTLLEYDNVKLRRVLIVDYGKGTPMENLIKKKPYDKSSWRIEHSSDVLRYLTLFKYGGVYLDTDTVVVKSLDTLANNWAARESEWAVDAGALSFSRDALGREVAKAAVEDLKVNYQARKWGNNGPGVITRVLKKMCHNNKKWNQGCNGFVVYEPALFYPVYYPKNKLYFTVGAKLPHENQTYIHHLWNAFTRDYAIPKGCPYDQLAKEHCPYIYTLFGDKFGS